MPTPNLQKYSNTKHNNKQSKIHKNTKHAQ